MPAAEKMYIAHEQAPSYGLTPMLSRREKLVYKWIGVASFLLNIAFLACLIAFGKSFSDRIGVVGWALACFNFAIGAIFGFAGRGDIRIIYGSRWLRDSK
jgi:hypothetical protein